MIASCRIQMEKEKKELAWDWQRRTQSGMNGSKDQNELTRRTLGVVDTCMN